MARFAAAPSPSRFSLGPARYATRACPTSCTLGVTSAAVTLQEALPFLIPLLVLQLTLMAVGLYDLTRPERRVRGGNKLIWGLVIVLGELIGPLVYFFFGREDV